MKIEISNGELIDKVSILKIKLEYIQDPIKLENINKEYQLLKSYMLELNITEDCNSFLELYQVNKDLWKIEESIRQKEELKEFDQEFVNYAREIYTKNDLRANIKKKVNISTQSAIVEEKSYTI